MSIPFATAADTGIADIEIPPEQDREKLRIAVLWTDTSGFPHWIVNSLDLARGSAGPDCDAAIRLPALSRVRIRLVGADGTVLARQSISIHAFLARPGEDPETVAFLSMADTSGHGTTIETDDVGEAELEGVSEALTLKFDFFATGTPTSVYSRVETNLLPAGPPGYYRAEPQDEYFVRVMKCEMPAFSIKVVDGADQAVKGALVGYFLAGPIGSGARLHTEAVAATDDAGTATLRLAWRSVEPARLDGCAYWIVAYSSGHGATYSRGLLSLADPQAQVQLSMQQTQIVRGRVLQEETGEPVAGINVFLRPFFVNWQAGPARSDLNGEFEFVLPKPPPPDWRPPDCRESDFRWRLKLASDSASEFVVEDDSLGPVLRLDDQATYRVREIR
ncbi:MAG: hypothetical protein HYY18_15640 [Planctomycetes bacterium]|nr:hypothetical protein [Planctomycetota bacterium]